MDIKFFVDENCSNDLVIALRLLGPNNIEHLLENFEAGTKDTVWLEYVGKNGLVVITKDQKIRKNPKEKAALLKYKIVAFFLSGKKMSGWELSKQLINAWEKIEAQAKRQKKKGIAGAFNVSRHGGKITEIPLT